MWDVSQGPEGLVYRPEPRMGMSNCGAKLTAHLAEICISPVIFRIAIGNSEALIEKSQIEKGQSTALTTSRRKNTTRAKCSDSRREGTRSSQNNKKQCTRRNIPEFRIGCAQKRRVGGGRGRGGARGVEEAA